MKYQIFWGGNVWQTDAITWRPDGAVEFDAQTKDGKFHVFVREWDIISERLNNIAVPTLTK